MRTVMAPATSDVGMRVRSGSAGSSMELTPNRLSGHSDGAIPGARTPRARFTRAGTAHPRAVMFTGEADGRGPAAAEAQPARATRPDLRRARGTPVGPAVLGED